MAFRIPSAMIFFFSNQAFSSNAKSTGFEVVVDVLDISVAMFSPSISAILNPNISPSSVGPSVSLLFHTLWSISSNRSETSLLYVPNCVVLNSSLSGQNFSDFQNDASVVLCWANIELISSIIGAMRMQIFQFMFIFLSKFNKKSFIQMKRFVSIENTSQSSSRKQREN